LALASEDDGFREIQLSGKQLVFLFMAATVVSVVIFLCGVLVGRGVRAERAAMARADVLNESPTADPAAPSSNVGGADSDPRDVGPPTAVVGEPEGADQKNAPAAIEEAPVAVDRSASNTPPRSVAPVAPPVAPPPAKPVTPPPQVAASSPSAAPAPPSAAPKASTPTPTVAAKAPEPAPSAAPAAAAETPRAGYAVQVAAVDVRGEADAMAKRLADKGYTAYVEQPKGTNVYRVRVGTYRTRREAQAVAEKLKREEKFNPWVTR
jgi:DedD protein